MTDGLGLLTRPAATQQQILKEGLYVSEFHKWNGFIVKIPILKSIINANADAVTASWRCTGTNGKAMAELLDTFDGNGKESFKLIMNNMLKVAKICGDSYAEIIYEGENVVNMTILPSDNIRQVVKKGRIVHYEEIDGAVQWQPQEIFHLAYNPFGAMTHGTSVIEPMNELLIDYLQVQDDMAKIYHRYTKPFHLVEVDTDSSTKIAEFEDKWKKLVRVPDADLIIPKNTISVTRTSMPQGSSLDPGLWHRILTDQLIMASRVPELALGTGSVNSEESARMQFMGFRQMIRWDQKFLEENLRRQLFTQVFPTDTPDITFSFAAEAQEEQFERLLRAFQVINGSALNNQIKGLALISIMEDMGLIEK